MCFNENNELFKIVDNDLYSLRDQAITNINFKIQKIYEDHATRGVLRSTMYTSNVAKTMQEEVNILCSDIIKYISELQDKLNTIYKEKQVKQLQDNSINCVNEVITYCKNRYIEIKNVIGMSNLTEDFSQNLSINCKNKLEFEINKIKSIKKIKTDSQQKLSILKTLLGLVISLLKKYF